MRMKKIILFLLFLTVQTVLFAQEHEYIPFVEEGKVLTIDGFNL